MINYFFSSGQGRRQCVGAADPSSHPLVALQAGTLRAQAGLHDRLPLLPHPLSLLGGIEAGVDGSRHSETMG